MLFLREGRQHSLHMRIESAYVFVLKQLYVFPFSHSLSHSPLSSSRLCVCTSLQVCRGCPCSLDSSPTWCFRSMTGTSWSPSPTLWAMAHPYFSSHTSFSLDRYISKHYVLYTPSLLLLCVCVCCLLFVY